MYSYTTWVDLGSWNLAILHWPRSLWGCWRPLNFRALYYNSSGHFWPSSCTSRQAINFFGPFRFMTSDDLSGHWGQQFRGPWESLHLSWTTEICFFQRKMHSSMSCNTQKLKSLQQPRRPRRSSLDSLKPVYPWVKATCQVSTSQVKQFGHPNESSNNKGLV